MIKVPNFQPFMILRQQSVKDPIFVKEFMSHLGDSPILGKNFHSHIRYLHICKYSSDTQNCNLRFLVSTVHIAVLRVPDCSFQAPNENFGAFIFSRKFAHSQLS
jgi:hypothetical protein